MIPSPSSLVHVLSCKTHTFQPWRIKGTCSRCEGVVIVEVVIVEWDTELMSEVTHKAPCNLNDMPTISAAGTSVDCKAWTARRSSAQRQRRSLSIRASSSPGNTAPGVSGSEVPLGGGVSTAPISQKDVPKAERIAYVCSACGYIYDLDLPFEEQPDSYACPGTSANNKLTLLRSSLYWKCSHGFKRYPLTSGCLHNWNSHGALTMLLFYMYKSSSGVVLPSASLL